MIPDDDYKQLNELSYYPTDATAVRTSINQKIKDAMSKSLASTEWGGIRMEVKNVKYAKPDHSYTFAEQKKAKLNNEYLSTKLQGDVYLYDSKTNELLDKAKNKTLQNVPYYTERGTFIHNGNEYATLKQLRLRPGIYSRKRVNGELESQFNIKRGTGRGYRITLNPQTGIYKLHTGQSSVNLYSVLKDIGVSDDDLKQAWGQDIYDTNKAKYDKRALHNLATKFISKSKLGDNPTQEQMINLLKESFDTQEVDDDIKQRNLYNITKTASSFKFKDDDNNTAKVGVDSIINASSKLLAINKGELDPDERDSLIYKRIMNTDDLIAERIDMDADKIKQQLMFKLSKQRNLKHLPSAAFDGYAKGHIVSNTLSLPSEEINPLFNRDQMNRLTVFGLGGINSADSVTDESQGVHPSQFGFIDAIASPESEKIGVDLRFGYNTRIHRKSGKPLTQIKDNKTGKIFWVTPDEIQNLTIGFPD